MSDYDQRKHFDECGTAGTAGTPADLYQFEPGSLDLPWAEMIGRGDGGTGGGGGGGAGGGGGGAGGGGGGGGGGGIIIEPIIGGKSKQFARLMSDTFQLQQEHVKFPAHTGLDITDNLTIWLWMRIDFIQFADQTILFHRFPNFRLTFSGLPWPTLNLIIRQGFVDNSATFNLSPYVTSGIPNFLCVTKDILSNTKCWITINADGDLAELPGVFLAASNSSTTDPLFVGGISPAGIAYVFPGAMQEYGIYNRAMTGVGEVQNIRDGSPPTNGLILWVDTPGQTPERNRMSSVGPAEGEVTGTQRIKSFHKKKAPFY